MKENRKPKTVAAILFAVHAAGSDRAKRKVVRDALEATRAEAYADGKAFGEHIAAPTPPYVELEKQLTALQQRFDQLRESYQKLNADSTQRVREIQGRDRKIQELEGDLKGVRAQRDEITEKLTRYVVADQKAVERRKEAAEAWYREPLPDGDIPLLDALIRGARLEDAPIVAVRQELIHRLTDRRDAIESTTPALMDVSVELAEWRLVGEVLLTHEVDTPAYDLAISMCDKLLAQASDEEEETPQ